MTDGPKGKMIVTKKNKKGVVSRRSKKYSGLYQVYNADGSVNRRWKFRYVDFEGRRRGGTGTTSDRDTYLIRQQKQSDQDAIRNGWKPRPKPSDKPMRFKDIKNEYLAWGKTQGGLRGFPWGKGHYRMKKSRLGWWEEKLSLECLSDLNGSLSLVEKALRELQNRGLRRKPLAGKTLQNYAEALASFCRWCKKRRYLGEDPLDGLAPFDTTPKTIRRAMTIKEIQTLLRTCSLKRRLTYEVAFTTGLRKGELESLRVKHLDQSRGGFDLEGRWTKNRREGFKVLSSALLGDLVASAKSKSPEAPLLYVPHHTARDLYKDLDAAGIPRFVVGKGKIDFQACRTAYCNLVLDQNVSVKDAQELMRHRTPDLTMNTYGRGRDDRMKKVSETIGESLRKNTGHTEDIRKVASEANDCGKKGYTDGGAGFLPVPPSAFCVFSPCRYSTSSPLMTLSCVLAGADPTLSVCVLL